MLLNILLVILVLDCLALVGVILLQRSEGGGFVSGGPSGMFTARGAGDLLTRTTAILTVIFFSLSLIITLLAGHSRQSSVADHLKVNPIDLNALAKQNAAKAPPPSESQAAPPLPNAAPPLPNAAQPAPAMPTAPPRPSASRPAPAPLTVGPTQQAPASSGQ
jgi:preprotein translocase subunit SecG